MKHILSFDIARGKSVYCFIDELKNVIIDATLIEHNKNDFDNLFNFIKDYPNLKEIMKPSSNSECLLNLTLLLNRGLIIFKIKDCQFVQNINLKTVDLRIAPFV